MFTRFLPAIACGCQRSVANYDELIFYEMVVASGFLRTVAEDGELTISVPCIHRISMSGDCFERNNSGVDFVLPVVLPIKATQELLLELTVLTI